MTKLFLVLSPLLTCSALFLTGAWDQPLSETARTISPPFFAQSQETPTGTELFDLALQRLKPDAVAWLRIGLWQRMSDPDVGFEAEGTLQLGPRHCARLDMQVRTSKNASRLLVVSDGHAIASIKHTGTDAPQVVSQLLAAISPVANAPDSPIPVAQLMRDNGCGGPYPIVKQLRERLTRLSVQTGTWNGRTVTRLRGSFLASDRGPDMLPTPKPEFCYLYLDAETLWPLRLEWWGTDEKHTVRPLLELEYRDPVLNRALSLDECIRDFSYSPSGGDP